MTHHPEKTRGGKLPNPVALPLSIDSVDGWCVGWHTSFSIKKLYAAVIPCATQREAREIVRMFRKSEAVKELARLKTIEAAAREYVRINHSKGGEDYDGSLAPLLASLQSPTERGRE